MKVKIDQRKLKDVSDYLAGITERLTDLSVPMWAGARRAKEDTDQDFATGGAFGGEVFAALRNATTERDKYSDSNNSGRPTTSHKPLILSGRFWSSVKAFAEKFAGGVKLGDAYNLNAYGTTSPKTGAPKNPVRDAGFISNETIDWTIAKILNYAVDENEK